MQQCHEEGVFRRRLEVRDDEDGHDQPVDGDDTGHDHGDDALHDELGLVHAHGRDGRPGLGGAIARAPRAQRDGGGGAHDADEGGVDGHPLDVGPIGRRAVARHPDVWWRDALITPQNNKTFRLESHTRTRAGGR